MKQQARAGRSISIGDIALKMTPCKKLGKTFKKTSKLASLNWLLLKTLRNSNDAFKKKFNGSRWK